MPEHSDPGQTHFVGDGCQPAHDPRIDQAPTDARVVAEAYRRASTGTGPVSFEELHAEYLVEIDAKVRAEKEIERWKSAHDPRIDQTPPDVWPHPTYIELERQVEQLQSALVVSEQQTADAEELWRADVKRLSEEVERLRVVLGSTLNYLESRLYKEATRTVRAALDDAKAS
jgi:hypothetical protein